MNPIKETDTFSFRIRRLKRLFTVVFWKIGLIKLATWILNKIMKAF